MDEICKNPDQKPRIIVFKISTLFLFQDLQIVSLDPLIQKNENLKIVYWHASAAMFVHYLVGCLSVYMTGSADLFFSLNHSHLAQPCRQIRLSDKVKSPCSKRLLF
jgi:hypothetical protein